MQAHRPIQIALLGAPCTGKTQLSLMMAQSLQSCGHRVAVVGEVLREWRTQEGRSPSLDDYEAIAQAQERRVDQAADGADIVIADTTALMVAVASAMRFEACRWHAFALERQRLYGLTLLTGLDLPWVADGMHRDGPHEREPVDARVRGGLQQAGIEWRVVYGQGPQRVSHALEALAAVAPWAWTPPVRQDEQARGSRLKALCEKCGDAPCEHRLFTGLTAPRL